MTDLPTIRDVARRAGVSVSTASLALNGKPRVNHLTRLRVLQSAEELGYHPHAAARQLADGRAHTVGLLSPISLEHLFASSGFFSQLIKGMHRAAAERGYNLSLHIAESDQEACSQIRTSSRGRSVDGFVITNPSVTCPYLEDLRRLRVPHVFVGRPAGQAPFVDSDNVAVSRTGVKHLIESGHRRIVFLSGPERFTFCQDRLLGYRMALQESGIPFDPGLVWQSEQVEEAAFQAVRQRAPAAEFTGMFAVSAIQAVGAVRALRELSLRVPEDVAIVCVNDSELARYFVPPLTTVDLREYWLGYWSAKRLLQLIEGDRSDHPILIPGKLVVRASSVRPGADLDEGGDRRSTQEAVSS
ncbi:MAG: LacI family DNA-binding transcriptional regulator [Candidatus Bipolaricaulaceae bacterium]